MTGRPPMFSQILTVCVGNICRSPVAEAMLRQQLGSRNPAVNIRSAGLDAMVGYPADQPTQAIASRFRLDLKNHRAQQLTARLIEHADLILVAEEWHRVAILSEYPSCRGKLYRLGHWRDMDIEDPYKKSVKHYATCIAKIKISIDSWIEHLC